MKLSPQTQRVYERMKNHEWFSNIECIEQLHILRLSNKIRELKAEGFTIEKDKKSKVGRYRIAPPKFIPVLPPAFPPQKVDNNQARLF